jgi:hypothetical protein
MVFLVQSAVVFVFPAGAIWAWRTGGPGRLWQYALVMALNLVLLALALASPLLGNRISPQLGYWPTARGLLALAALTQVLPSTVAALVVQRSAPRFASRYQVYALSATGAFLASAAGVIAASYALRGTM